MDFSAWMHNLDALRLGHTAALYVAVAGVPLHSQDLAAEAFEAL